MGSPSCKQVTWTAIVCWHIFIPSPSICLYAIGYFLCANHLFPSQFLTPSISSFPTHLSYDTHSTMIPLQQPYTSTLSMLWKIDLLCLSLEFKLLTDGTVINLRDRLSVYLNSHSEIPYRYWPLYPQHKWATHPVPPPEQEEHAALTVHHHQCGNAHRIYGFVRHLLRILAWNQGPSSAPCSCCSTPSEPGSSSTCRCSWCCRLLPSSTLTSFSLYSRLWTRAFSFQWPRKWFTCTRSPCGSITQYTHSCSGYHSTVGLCIGWLWLMWDARVGEKDLPKFQILDRWSR